MEAVRLTFHKGYRHKDGTPYSPKHNDRNGFEKEKSAENNVYGNYAALTWGGETFAESEMLGYKACFGAHIKRYNDQRKKERHPEECIDIKQYYKKHPPEETLLYLGKMNNNVGSEVLLEVFAEYREWLNSTCADNDKGCGVELLNAALHMDEATPHIHFRQMYYYTDKYGNFEISQNKALEGLGYGKGINAKKDFTAKSRDKLIEIAKSHGVELIEEPLPKEKTGKSLEVYIAREKMEQEFQEREKALCVKTENAKQAIQAERAKLCAETKKAEQELAKHEQAIENAYDDLEKAVGKTKAEIKQNEEIIRDQREEIDSQKEYITFKRAKADEKAKQEAQKAREEREKLAREIRKEAERAASAEKIVYRQNPQIAAEEENARESVQNAPETPESVEVIPDTPKAQTPLKNARRSFAEIEDETADFLENWDFGL